VSLPETVLWGLRELGLRMRPFVIPLEFEPVQVVQAWHPRFDKDLAHRWLRQTVKEICGTVNAHYAGIWPQSNPVRIAPHTAAMAMPIKPKKNGSTASRTALSKLPASSQRSGRRVSPAA
nr:hypothetical protein [Tanacetum cinerariifolium]